MDSDQRPSSATGERPRKSSENQLTSTNSRDKQQQPNGNRRPSGSGTTTRVCAKCGEPLSGQFVRALEGTYHLDCFTCHDCGKVVASKFFPIPEQPPHEYPLCEVDYFKRLGLLCHDCGGALRGSYITALDRKYHIEHFTCSVCPTIFGAQDSYYEHDGSVYCHYHYSTRFAQRCNGCQTAILKQFVEIFRNGQNQHWHPECYMIHKYWNVRLHSPEQPVIQDRRSVDGDASEEERNRVRYEEEKIEEKVLMIWRTTSAYEERSATCISDMLLHVSNGAYVDGVMSAKKFILHVDLLFSAADDLDYLMMSNTPKGLSYSREAKLLCKKVVAFFQLLARSQDTGVRRLGVTQELLSLVTGLAHYLKLLIRICLQGSLKLERDTGSEQGLHQFLDTLGSLDAKLESEDTNESAADAASYVDLSADTCPICTKPVEDRCFRHKSKIIHTTCMKCESCQRDLSIDHENAHWDERDERLLCNNCAGSVTSTEHGFYAVSRLQQYLHLLRVAHARLLETLRTSGALPHTSDDPNLDKYDSSSGHRVGTNEASNPPLLRSGSRSKSYTGKPSTEEKPSDTYEQTLGHIRRLRSTRIDKQVSNTMKKARTSRIIDGPEGSSVRPGSSGNEEADKKNLGFHIVQERDVSGEPVSQLTFGNHESIRLDDIPRIVAAEQAKDQRPNASKYARGGLSQQEPKPKMVSGHRRDTSGAQELEKLGPEGFRPKKYFSELSALEYFIVRHVAVLSMEPLLEGYFNQEELLDLIEMRKPTFWGKFGKAFVKDKPKGGRKKGVFGVALDQLIERDGAESTDGVGPGALRVPAIVQDAVTAMRSMDMSMEGVFRKNGNIRRLKEAADTIDNKGADAVDLNVESPVQVAALLKKFLRELPDPVMTYKLHRLFVTTQKIPDEDKRRRVLHLSCCLLPKSHRDTMEVLFNFLNWTASFSVVDEESGSKMDVHNLATVIAPNILFSNNKNETMEDSFLAIEAVHNLIEYNEAFCEVPEDLQSILNDSTLFSGSADLTTKEILKRYEHLARTPTFNAATSASTNPTSAYADDSTLNSSPQTTTFAHRSREARTNQPAVHTIDDRDAPSAWQAESSVRAVGGNTSQGASPIPNAIYGGGSGSVPGSSNKLSSNATTVGGTTSQNGFYANPTPGSRDSFGLNGSDRAAARAGSPSRWSRFGVGRDPSGSNSNGGNMGVT